MKLPPEGARWLVSLRWLACAAVFAVTWLTSSVLGDRRRPAAAVRDRLRRWSATTCCSTWRQRRTSAGEGNVERNIFLQVAVRPGRADAAARTSPICRGTRSCSTSSST